MRATFERELQQVQDQLLVMGSEIEENLVKVASVMTTYDINAAKLMIRADEWVNEKRITIMMTCLTMIATQQPTGRDMRLLASIMEIAGELERIHDYVKGIARISLLVGEQPIPDFLAAILPQMAQYASQMMHQAMDAFVRRDATLAQAIPHDDDLVDDLFKQAHRGIASYIMSDPTVVERANYLQWAAHNLERSADRVTNVCEWIVYLVTGTYVEMDNETMLEALPA